MKVDLFQSWGEQGDDTSPRPFNSGVEVKGKLFHKFGAVSQPLRVLLSNFLAGTCDPLVFALLSWCGLFSKVEQDAPTVGVTPVGVPAPVVGVSSDRTEPPLIGLIKHLNRAKNVMSGDHKRTPYMRDLPQ